MRTKCHCWAVICEDGLVLRWDRTDDDEPKVRLVFDWDGRRPTVTWVAPRLSEGVLYCSPDPASFALPEEGPRIQMGVVDPATGQMTPFVDVFVVAVAPWGTSTEQADVTRPMPIASIANDFTVQMLGEMIDQPASGRTDRQFLIKGQFELPVGWRMLEVFPPYPGELWRPELAAAWAELDLLTS
jgi:hypothetical protein